MASFKISGTLRTGTPKPASCIREYSYAKAVLKGNGEGLCAEYAGKVVGKHHQKAREQVGLRISACFRKLGRAVLMNWISLNGFTSLPQHLPVWIGDLEWVLIPYVH